MMAAKTCTQRTSRFSHSRIDDVTLSTPLRKPLEVNCPGKSYTRSGSRAAECENSIHRLAPGTLLLLPDRACRSFAARSNFRWQKLDDGLLPREPRLPAGTEDSGHLDLCVLKSTVANLRSRSVSPVSQAHPWRACLSPYPECGLICVSSLEPFSQPDLHNLALLLGRFVKFSFCVVSQALLKNLQNLRRRLTRSTHYESTVETPLVFSIAVGQGVLYRGNSLRHLLLLLRRPFYRSRRHRLRFQKRRSRFADPRMTLERFHPIGSRETTPRFVRRTQERSHICERSSRHHFLRPSFGYAKRQ